MLRFHDLRHTCASILIAARADLAFIARQLGHATPATTLLIYAHLFDEAANLTRVHDYVTDQFGTSLVNSGTWPGHLIHGCIAFWLGSSGTPRVVGDAANIRARLIAFKAIQSRSVSRRLRQRLSYCVVNDASVRAFGSPV